MNEICGMWISINFFAILKKNKVCILRNIMNEICGMWISINFFAILKSNKVNGANVK